MQRHFLHSFLLVLTGTTLFATGLPAQAQSLFVSEFVASNQGRLKDADGDTPDWIELYNASTSTVNLAGWHLTDCTTNLTQWTFPATNLPPQGFLVVFASDKNRAVSGEELHTNFKLSADGEYLALIHPDGTTVEWDITFPPQYPNEAYGYVFTDPPESSLLLSEYSPCTAHIPTSANDSIDWKNPDFDDTVWKQGSTGVGYDYGSLIGLDTREMRYRNGSVYIRIPFVSQGTEPGRFWMDIKYEDGFVAWLNGTEVARVHFTGIPAWNSLAESSHSDDLAVRFETFDLSAHTDLLQPGTNWLTIQGMNNNISSSDLLILPQLQVQEKPQIDPSEIGFLPLPTPRTFNPPNRYSGVLGSKIEIEPAHGFYESPFSATLSCSDTNVVLRYTTDGSTPNTNSPIYTGSISISSTTPLRAASFRDGWKPSPSATKTYLFLDDVVQEPQYFDTSPTGQKLWFGMNPDVVNRSWVDPSNQSISVKDALLAVPTLSIVTDEENLFDPDTGIYVNAPEKWERPASFELISPEKEEGFQINAGLRIRGGWSRHDNFPKHSFRLFFRSEYGAGKLKFPLFGKEGIDEFDKIDLRTPQNYSWAKQKDTRNTFMRDLLARNLSRALGQPYTRSRYYHLYINGHYWGLYQTEERPEANYAASYFDGKPEDYDVVKTGNWTDPAELKGKVRPTDGNLDAYYRLHAAMTNGFAGNNPNYFAIQGLGENGRPDPSKEKLLDLRNMIDYLLVIYHTGASDNGITHFRNDASLNNLFAIYNRTKPNGFKWIEHDCEHAYDTTTDIDRTGPFTNLNASLPEYFNAQTLHEHLCSNTEYRVAFADEVYRAFSGPLANSNVVALLDDQAVQINRAILAHSARWGNATELTIYAWTNAVQELRDFIAISNRNEQVLGYLQADGLLPSINPPHINTPSGKVQDETLIGLSAEEGTLYFTTDGSDPRAIGGDIAGTIYSEPLSIHCPTLIRARALSNSGEWSALVEATFWTETVPLAITEIMYHAPDGALDFIEIQNRSTIPVSLEGYSIEGTIRAELPQETLQPYAFLLLVDNLEAFSFNHPELSNTLQIEYIGNLENDAGEFALAFTQASLLSLPYSDARNWPQSADGGGHSLVPTNAALDREIESLLDYGGNWRASAYRGGSPGAEDPAPPSSVVLNEIIAHTDTGQPPPFDSNDQIELFNPTAAPVDLSGWSLSDRLEASTNAWVIPDETTIAAHGFLLFDEDDFHAGRTNGFGINKAGEQIALNAPDRMADAIRFKSQENGRSLGRFPDGTAPWQPTEPTPGSANRLAETTVFIDQVQYHPIADDNALEYIRLSNTSAQSVSFGSANMTWRIDGEVAFNFPADTTLPAGTIGWIVSFSPTNTALASRFRATYALPGTALLLGPFSGHLSNHKGRVALERPQEPDFPDTNISWVVVDELFYFDRAPWPQGADGSGFPLVRATPTDWTCPALGNPEADDDGDGRSNQSEFIAHTDPADPQSILRLQLQAPGTLAWVPAEGRHYALLWTPTLSRGFQYLEADLPYPASTLPVTSSDSVAFYKLTVRIPSETDTDADGLLDNWEIQFFGNLTSTPMQDSDRDGIANIGEYLAGTDPTDPASVLRLSQTPINKGTRIDWSPVVLGRSYTVLYTPSLLQPYQILTNNLPYPQNSYTNTAPATVSGFYQIEATLK